MKLKNTLKKINILKNKMSGLSDADLKKQTKYIKEKIDRGASKKEILIEAFATIREADKRVLGMTPTDEQVIAGIVLANGSIAEMKTGEGKSLVATFPLYLKALYDTPAFLVTTNDYLARRDFLRIGPVFSWMGLSVLDGSNTNKKEAKFDYNHKKNIYKGDIIYTSNSALGFDYLIDGLASSEDEQFMSKLSFALIDEVDEVLLDSAQMPLIISGGAKVQSNYHKIASEFTLSLIKDIDFKMDEEGRSVWLTETGISSAKDYFSIDSLLSEEYFSLYQHLILALKAHYTLKKNRDYIVETGKIKILDKKDGRILEGTSLQSGLHQALEAKEGVELTSETKTVSSITYQNLFRQFKEISGMSGTAKISESEFISTYNINVKKIKSRNKNIRVDHKPVQYVTFASKITALILKIKELYKTKRPILIITGSVDSSELVSLHLLQEGIPHNMLNAKSSAKEALMIKEAGKVGAVTISTAMAGRGTDIKLEEDSLKKGGLAVIITERMINQRVEQQAKGRAGRQGEPGESYVFESLEDDIIKRHIQEKIQKYYDRHFSEEAAISDRNIKRYFDQAQKLSEDAAEMERSKALQFDEILRIQKQAVDTDRKSIIKLRDIENINEFVLKHACLVFKDEIKIIYEEEGSTRFAKLKQFILDNVDYNFKSDEMPQENIEDIIKFATNILKENLNNKRKIINNDEIYLKFLQMAILKAVDTTWAEQVEALNQIRYLVASRTSAQKQPFREFEQEAKRNFEYRRRELSQSILKNTALSLTEIKGNEMLITFP